MPVENIHTEDREAVSTTVFSLLNPEPEPKPGISIGSTGDEETSLYGSKSKSKRGT